AGEVPDLWPGPPAVDSFAAVVYAVRALSLLETNQRRSDSRRYQAAGNAAGSNARAADRRSGPARPKGTGGQSANDEGPTGQSPQGPRQLRVCQTGDRPAGKQNPVAWRAGRKSPGTQLHHRPGRSSGGQHDG